MDDLPLIGLTLETPSTPQDSGSDENGALYVEALCGAGARVALLDRVPAADAPDQLDGLDGLCLSGGGDMHGDYFGEETSTRATELDRERDEQEMALIAAARQRGLPMLGICRGCQVLNVGYGGGLHQDLAEEAPFTTRKHNYKAKDEDRFHPIRLAPNHPLADVVGTAAVTVNSHHHQAVSRLGDGLRAVAWSEDGVVEAVAHIEEPTLGVQWHPERMEPEHHWSLRLFIGTCRARGGA